MKIVNFANILRMRTKMISQSSLKPLCRDTRIVAAKAE
jgi:hypothetical protein